MAKTCQEYFHFTITIAILILSLIMFTPATAEIYRCVDENGNARFTTKPGPGCKLLPGSVVKEEPPRLHPPQTQIKAEATRKLPKKRMIRSHIRPMLGKLRA